MEIISAGEYRKLCFIDNRLVGTIRLIPASVVIPMDSPKYWVDVLREYKDSRLKITRTTTKSLNGFDTLDKAIEAIKKYCK